MCVCMHAWMCVCKDLVVPSGRLVVQHVDVLQVGLLDQGAHALLVVVRLEVMSLTCVHPAEHQGRLLGCLGILTYCV